MLFDPELGVAVADPGDEEGDEESILYRVVTARRANAREEEARRLLYVAAARAREQLILTSTEGGTKRFCGLKLLVPGLEFPGIECAQEASDPKDARPKDLPAPLPESPRCCSWRPIMWLDRGFRHPYLGS